jgi:hypothetical protein
MGSVLILSGWNRVSRPSLAERLRPFVPGPADSPARSLLSAESMGELVRPAARYAGDRLASLFGVSEQLEVRLRRVHSPLDVSAFRTRQLGWSGAVLAGGLAVAAARASLPLAVLSVAGGPLLAFLIVEQRLARASDRWKEQVAVELPVVAEQLAMLINAGYSLGAAIGRIATRGQGCCARDLAMVVNRIQQGVGESKALREWAEVARVESVDRLVGVLATNSQATDLGRLVGTEARQARRELQRRTTEIIERRGQQVWVPVTVATLVPGAILLAVPFYDALHVFSSA